MTLVLLNSLIPVLESAFRFPSPPVASYSSEASLTSGSSVPAQPSVLCSENHNLSSHKTTAGCLTCLHSLLLRSFWQALPCLSLRSPFRSQRSCPGDFLRAVFLIAVHLLRRPLHSCSPCRNLVRTSFGISLTFPLHPLPHSTTSVMRDSTSGCSLCPLLNGKLVLERSCGGGRYCHPKGL